MFAIEKSTNGVWKSIFAVAKSTSGIEKSATKVRKIDSQFGSTNVENTSQRISIG